MMHSKKINVLAILLAFFSINSFANAGELTINLTNIKKDGVMYLAIFDRKEIFESSEKFDRPEWQQYITKIKKEVTKGKHTEVVDLPDGEYGIFTFIDADRDEELKMGFFGPKEQYGVSNNVKARFGPPKFKKVAFDVKGKTQIGIKYRK